MIKQIIVITIAIIVVLYFFLFLFKFLYDNSPPIPQVFLTKNGTLSFLPLILISPLFLIDSIGEILVALLALPNDDNKIVIIANTTANIIAGIETINVNFMFCNISAGNKVLVITDKINEATSPSITPNGIPIIPI